MRHYCLLLCAISIVDSSIIAIDAARRGHSVGWTLFVRDMLYPKDFTAVPIVHSFTHTWHSSLVSSVCVRVCVYFLGFPLLSVHYHSSVRTQRHTRSLFRYFSRRTSCLASPFYRYIFVSCVFRISLSSSFAHVALFKLFTLFTATALYSLLLLRCLHTARSHTHLHLVMRAHVMGSVSDRSPQEEFYIRRGMWSFHSKNFCWPVDEIRERERERVCVWLSASECLRRTHSER